MHIKQITISNFRSFRQQSELPASFSAQTNAVIGRNGSGKSNLFDAVQFCLAAPPRFTHLRPEERQALLHEGSGSAAVNAFVEIVFDNSDQRFASVDSSSAGTGHLPDEVVLRRTVGLKKDEFFLQRKRCTKQEVQSLLEGAGFSKSNPYFIVQQGKVQDLCTMSDHERLALLKEVAGTTTYDDRKAESLTKMQDNQASIDKIAEVLEDIENRLQELQTERQELDAYQTHDRSRRAVEYSLYDQQWRKARTTLDALEEERGMHLQELRTVHDAAKDTHDGIRSIEAQLASQTSALRRHKQGPLALCKEEKLRFQTKTTKLMLQVQEMEESVTTLDQEWQTNQKELVSVDAKIRHAETLLEESLEPQKVKADQELNNMVTQRSEAQRKLQALYAKQGRGRQFASRQERDAFLQTQLDDLEATRTEKVAFLDEQRLTVLANLRRNVIAQEEHELNAHISTVTSTRNTALCELTKSLETQQALQLELHESRQAAQRVSATLQDSVRQAQRNVHQARADFRKCLPRATAQGLAALETLVEQEGLIRGQHYWGMLLENITLQHAKYQTAVEVAAQNSLFHVICDTDETASKLMKRLEQGKLGRVTFLPLNTLVRSSSSSVDDTNNNNNRRLPDSLAKTDVCPLLDVCLQYDPTLEAAMQHVFGKKLLCRTAELAAEWSTKLQTDAITLEGDLCGSKGALTGGYVDSTKSRMRAFAQKTQSQEALQNFQTQLDEAKNKATLVDQEANQLVQEVQRIEAKHAELTFLLQQEEGHVERLQTRLNLHRAQEENLVSTVLPPLERELETLQKDVDNLQEEMKTELAVTLSEQDREMMQQLKEVQTDLAAQIAEQKEVVAQAGLEVQKVKSLLQDNLFKRRDELIAGSSLAQKDNENGQDDEDDDDDDVDGGDDTAMAATPARRRRQRQLQNSRRRGGGGVGGSHATISAAALLKQRQEDLQEAQQALDSAMALKEKAEERLEEARDTERELRTALHSAKNELEQLRTKDVQNAKSLEEAQDKSERLLTKRSMAMSKRETYARKIQELGSLPPPAELQKYAELTISQLMNELEKINKKLKKYSHVNKKAFDQYVNFSEQRESLLHRKEQLDSDDIKIKELIESLDRKKDEAINRTFRGVSSHFKDVFKELVPNGSGELIMRTALDEGGPGNQTDEEKEDSSDDSTLSPKKKKAKTAAESQESTASTTGPNINLYRGVGIKVRFSEIGENFMMSQLSGGQKALVALALIFAIQRCDPAPFYLFDELDQALDQTYRSAVANLIQKQANSEENPTQFIVSTFRPELVRVANQCYGISHQNKVSSVHPFQKREALKFISNLMNEEEALGEVSKTGGAAAAARKRKSVDQGKRQQQQDEDDDASASQEEGSTTEDGKATAASASVAEASSMASQSNKQKSPLSPATEDSGKDDEEEDATSEESTP